MARTRRTYNILPLKTKFDLKWVIQNIAVCDLTRAKPNASNKAQTQKYILNNGYGSCSRLDPKPQSIIVCHLFTCLPDLWNLSAKPFFLGPKIEVYTEVDKKPHSSINKIINERGRTCEYIVQVFCFYNT
ncbi:10125_t:CDS:2 [Acaulospora morrowiae]|uniref:10125_t:CDS:1 n=1 Tax=Acaulospora morrowiae TaxID=94023 RepID=A0A9N9D2D0_9GLOM|nr:10125_t:CDS:2 [Acaulospora morrowiae]